MYVGNLIGAGVTLHTNFWFKWYHIIVPSWDNARFRWSRVFSSIIGLIIVRPMGASVEGIIIIWWGVDWKIKYFTCRNIEFWDFFIIFFYFLCVWRPADHAWGSTWLWIRVWNFNYEQTWFCYLFIYIYIYFYKSNNIRFCNLISWMDCFS